MRTSRNGEIITALTIGAFIVISLATIASSFFSNKNPQTTTSKAAESNSRFIVIPGQTPSGYIWESDYDNSLGYLNEPMRSQRGGQSAWCVNSNECKQNVGNSDSGFVNAAQSNFCYTFGANPPNVPAQRCVMLRYPPALTQAPTPPGATGVPTGAPGCNNPILNTYYGTYNGANGCFVLATDTSSVGCYIRSTSHPEVAPQGCEFRDTTSIGNGQSYVRFDCSNVINNFPNRAFDQIGGLKYAACNLDYGQISWKSATNNPPPVATPIPPAATATSIPPTQVPIDTPIPDPPTRAVPPPKSTPAECSATSCSTCISQSGCGWADGVGCEAGVENSCKGTYWHWNSCSKDLSDPLNTVRVQRDAAACPGLNKPSGEVPSGCAFTTESACKADVKNTAGCSYERRCWEPNPTPLQGIPPVVTDPSTQGNNNPQCGKEISSDGVCTQFKHENTDTTFWVYCKNGERSTAFGDQASCNDSLNSIATAKDAEGTGTIKIHMKIFEPMDALPKDTALKVNDYYHSQSIKDFIAKGFKDKWNKTYLIPSGEWKNGQVVSSGGLDFSNDNDSGRNIADGDIDMSKYDSDHEIILTFNNVKRFGADHAAKAYAVETKFAYGHTEDITFFSQVHFILGQTKILDLYADVDDNTKNPTDTQATYKNQSGKLDLTDFIHFFMMKVNANENKLGSLQLNFNPQFYSGTARPFLVMERKLSPDIGTVTSHDKKYGDGNFGDYYFNDLKTDATDDGEKMSFTGTQDEYVMGYERNITDMSIKVQYWCVGSDGDTSQTVSADYSSVYFFTTIPDLTICN